MNHEQIVQTIQILQTSIISRYFHATIDQSIHRNPSMSLYFDAVSILTAPPSIGGSFKSRIYSSRDLKASPAQIYALITDASKWDILLKEVVENAGILSLEPKVRVFIFVT